MEEWKGEPHEVRTLNRPLANTSWPQHTKTEDVLSIVGRVRDLRPQSQDVRDGVPTPGMLSYIPPSVSTRERPRRSSTRPELKLSSHSSFYRTKCLNHSPQPIPGKRRRAKPSRPRSYSFLEIAILSYPWDYTFLTPTKRNQCRPLTGNCRRLTGVI